MAGFDTTNVAATVGQGVPQNNPLMTLQSVAGIQNQLNQNRLFQAQQAGGNAFLQSVGPNGVVDPGTLKNALQGIGPQAGLVAPEMMGNSLTQQTTGLANTGTRIGALKATIAAIPPGPNQTDQALAALRRGVQTGQWKQEEASAYAGEGLPDLIKQSAIQTGSPSAQSAQYGDVSMVDKGSVIQPTLVNRVSGTVAPLGEPISKGLTPQDLSTRVQVADPVTGAPRMGVMADYVNPDGTWKGGMPHPLTALDPLSNNAQATLGAAYGPQIAGFEQTAAQSPQRRQNIENMRQEATQFIGGPNSNFWTKVGELGQEYGIKLPVPADSTETAAREAFQKSMTMVLSQQQAALHLNQTDAARQTAEAAVPSANTTAEGRNQVLGILEGNEDMIGAAGKAWQAQKAKGGAASWGQFQGEFSNRVPPSIFQSQYMTPAEISAMQKGWSQQRIDHWNAVKAAAAKQGWLPNAQ